MKCSKCGKNNVAGTPLCKECGAWLAGEPTSAEGVDHENGAATGGEDWLSGVRVLLAEGKKLEAIKVYREQTGVGLAEAKDAVERLGSGRPPLTAQGPALAGEALERAVLPLLESGYVIAAVKMYRTHAGLDLKDAKGAVDALVAKYALQDKVSSHVRISGVGSLLFLAVAVGVAAAVVYLATAG